MAIKNKNNKKHNRPYKKKLYKKPKTKSKTPKRSSYLKKLKKLGDKVKKEHKSEMDNRLNFPMDEFNLSFDNFPSSPYS